MTDKKKRVRHFTAKAAGRVVAYARRDGADDAQLARLIIEAYGLSNVPCLMSQSVMVLTNAAFVGSILVALKGLLGILKGVKIVVEGHISAYTLSPIEHFIRIYLPEIQTQYGAVVVWVSTATTVTAGFVALLTTLLDQIVYYKFLDSVCSAKTPANPFPISPPPPDFELFYQQDMMDKSRLERFGDLTDTLFPDA